jgi:beta-xylosidase
MPMTDAPDTSKPSGKPRDPALDAAVTLARWMDRRFVDPLLGLVLPGVGDMLGAALGVYPVVLAWRRGAPKALLARMLLNLAADALGGAIPIVGDVWDFLFRAHARNLALLQARASGRAVEGRASDRLIVAAAVLALLLALAAPVVAVIAAVRAFTAGPPHPVAGASAAAFPWVPDRGDGSYRNPVIHADYSDPDVLRVGDEYFMTASSFTATPGLPILRSRDLVNWRLAGHALENVPGARYDEFQAGAGVWAPALREHAGRFHLFFPTPDEGIYVLTAPHPTGPWSAPRLLAAGRGLIDPCPFWDDDGRAYLVHAYAGSRAGIKDRLRLRPMAPDASQLLGEGEIVFHDPARHPTLEGPKLYKHDGWYIILAPAGGVTHGWQVALRSRRIFGPYEDRIVLQQGRTSINGPHQGALVDTPGGAWWFVHFQDAGVYGRIVHLNPVRWQDGWPLMGDAGRDVSVREPVFTHAKPALAPAPIEIPATSDDFDRSPLAPQWQWHANHDPRWATLEARKGFLRLSARPAPKAGLGAAPHLLLQKLPAAAFTVETSMDSGAGAARAGLVVAGRSTAALLVDNAGAASNATLTLSIDDRSVERASIPRATVALGLDFAAGGMCRFWYRLAGGAVSRLEHSFQAAPGRWVGAQVGVVALGDDPARFADFDYFHFRAPQPAR